MPTIVHYIVVSMLFAIPLAYTILTIRITRGTRRQRQLSADIAQNYSSLGVAGCSIVCSRVHEIEQLHSMLTTECDRYEVILVLDTNLYADEADRIIQTFKMIRVNTPDYSELPHTPIRTLYRSRQRAFRRLILIDKGFTSTYDDLNAATAISSYDYLLPVTADTRIRQSAIEDLIITLADHAYADFDIIHSVADGYCVFHRDAIVSAGGFNADIPRKIRHSKTLDITFPLLSPPPQPSRLTFFGIAAILGIGVAIIYILFGLQTAIIAMLTAAILAVTTIYSAITLEGKCSSWPLLCYIRSITQFFLRKKFLIS